VDKAAIHSKISAQKGREPLAHRSDQDQNSRILGGNVHHRFQYSKDGWIIEGCLGLANCSLQYLSKQIVVNLQDAGLSSVFGY